MLIHIMVGTLILALVCFGIGLLASRPSLIRRERRLDCSHTVSAADTRPIAPTRVTLRPSARRVNMRITR